MESLAEEHQGRNLYRKAREFEEKAQSRSRSRFAPPRQMEGGTYPFAHQILDRQKRKHEELRGSESRFLRHAGSSQYTGIKSVPRLGFATKAFESSIEGDFWVVADFLFTDMIAGKAQPGLLQLDVAGGHSDWYPDAWIRRRGRRDLLVECKPIAEAKPDPEKYPDEAAVMNARLAAMEAASIREGMDFRLYTEIQIRVEPRFHNAMAMKRSFTAHISQQQFAEIEAQLPSLPQILTVMEFSHHLGPLGGGAMHIACQLDRRGKIRLDRKNYFLTDSYFHNLMAGALS
ncbi:hypothetical protein [Devosia sp. LjRoot3]|uniref:hypothetical protein n=1 Tax=Devosia sp. LjRoot3 TaxID=3342319 RepID=UPI003ECF9709